MPTSINECPDPTEPGFQPMKIHKRMVILWLEAHPEDEIHLLTPEWHGRLAEYLQCLREAPGQYFVDGALEEGS